MTMPQRDYSFKNISSAATTTVVSGAGFLHTLTLNKLIASDVVTIYDNTAASGTKIGTVTLPATLLQQAPQTAIFDVNFKTGLTIVTGQAGDYTVSFVV